MKRSFAFKVVWESGIRNIYCQSILDIRQGGWCITLDSANLALCLSYPHYNNEVIPS